MTLKISKRCTRFDKVKDLSFGQAALQVDLTFISVFERFLNNPLDFCKPLIFGKMPPLHNCFRCRIQERCKMFRISLLLLYQRSKQPFLV